MINRLFIFTLISLFCLPYTVVGQRAKDLHKNATKLYKRGFYEEAIPIYEKYAKKNVLPAEANFRIAESYRLSNRLKQSEPYYKKALDQGIKNDTAEFYYGLALLDNQKYDLAENQLKSFINQTDSITPDYFTTYANTEIKNLEKIREIKEKKSYYEVVPVRELNTSGADYAPFYHDGYVYFTSTRSSNKVYKATGQGFSNIYKAPFTDRGIDYNNIEEVPNINDPNVNDGTIAINDDGTTIIYAKGNTGKKKGREEVNLFITRYNKRTESWSEPRMMKINERGYWTSSPVFSANGRTLYFASNRPGGYGGVDLYSAQMDAYGNFRAIKNLGAEINSPGNEMFPYVHENGTLYFSSDGLPGFGGLDLFRATRNDGVIEVENLGEGINSAYDDFAITYTYPLGGLFSSNRPSGVGDDDIYVFVNNDPEYKVVDYFLTVQTLSNDQGKIEPLENTRVQVFNETGKLLERFFTDGDGKFKMKVTPESNYLIVGEKPEYFTTRLRYSTNDKGVDKSQLEKYRTVVNLDTSLTLLQVNTKTVFELENIYYDLDKADIRPDAARELDKLVTILRDNPDISIELSSHTDSRAADAYNLDLSQRRAQSAVDYIISQGIDENRLIPIGYGETQLKNECANGVECSEDKHQENRRTEFRVTGYNLEAVQAREQMIRQRIEEEERKAEEERIKKEQERRQQLLLEQQQQQEEGQQPKEGEKKVEEKKKVDDGDSLYKDDGDGDGLY
ncbi:OmpA family protein [Marinigracilibium pacificum]|uniref:OmpA family protein n=1 Tax=Marinigracilibium pacificum TaxID=2729599 RepID=A0A848IRS5_9BACT|nr:OmpA family protein [Marinigracilibium pacificum]NMM47173.1 OmpA family protein [Marinigracilibium pacificum]